MAFEKTIQVLSTTAGIDAKIATTTDLYTVPTGLNAIITGAIIRLITASGITIVPTLGIGINGTQDDIFSPIGLTGITTAGKIFAFHSLGTIPTATAGSVVKLGIDIGATATTMTMAIELLGYLTT